MSVLSKRTETSHQKISNVALPRMCSGRGPESSPATETLNRFCEWYFSCTEAWKSATNANGSNWMRTS